MEHDGADKDEEKDNDEVDGDGNHDHVRGHVLLLQHCNVVIISRFVDKMVLVKIIYVKR